jgi:hypothetical protein
LRMCVCACRWVQKLRPQARQPRLCPPPSRIDKALGQGGALRMCVCLQVGAEAPPAGPAAPAVPPAEQD